MTSGALVVTDGAVITRGAVVVTSGALVVTGGAVAATSGAVAVTVWAIALVDAGAMSRPRPGAPHSRTGRTMQTWKIIQMQFQRWINCSLKMNKCSEKKC